MSITISTALLKGGAGKTTTAIALAETAALGGSVTLIDCDPMGGAYDWSRLAAESGQPLRSTVVPMATEDLPRRIGPASRGADVVIVDAPPPGALQIARSAIWAADYVVIPVPPEMAALYRVPATADVAREYGKPVRAVLTMVRGLPAERDRAMSLLEAFNMPVFKTELPFTVAVPRNFGLPVTGVLARFGLDLLTEILSSLQEANANA